MIYSQNNQKFLFVCGCPRSGTSTVTDWLMSSEKIAIGMDRYQNRVPRIKTYRVPRIKT